jgi:hypothetical protein
MRLPGLLSFAAAVAVLAVPPAVAQEVKHWPLASISFPVDLAQFNQLSPKPVSIRFYAASRDGKFNLVKNRKPTELDEIVDTKDPAATPRRGFTYTATADGEEEFAVQYEYADGSLTPAKLTPQFRIKFDTRPPGVKAVASGGNSIRWQVEDENLVRESIRVEGRYAGSAQWEFLNTGELKPEDSFKWNVPPGKTLEVRVYARDRAGHENRSLPIRLTGGDTRADADRGKSPAPTPSGSFGDPVKAAGGKTGTGYGGLDELPANRPRIEYVSTNRLRVSSKVTHVTRSGVKAAQLFVLEPTSGADWKAAGRKEGLTITPDSPDAERVVGIEYEAPRDGLYGFVLQPISGAGTKLEDPRPGDTPQYLVYVDTTLPEMTLRRVNVTGSGLNGPLVEIEWEAKDAGSGFHPEPIVLEYSEDGQKWKPIAAKTANTGRYTWEITDKKLWKFFVRGSATDMAGNTKLVTYTDDKNLPAPVLVDLDKPSGSVDKVNPNGPPSAQPIPQGVSSDTPGVGGGGVTGVSAPPPDKLPGVTPIGSPAPNLVDPPSAVPTVKPKPPTPPVSGPPVPGLPKPDDPKPTPPKADPKRPDDKKKTELLLPDAAAGEPINLPAVPPAAVPSVPVTPIPLPALPDERK